VATLIILRGTAPDREIEIGDRTLRLGRGDQNDVVLPDPAKALSRFHAELRAENGQFIVVDLNSQNGVWLGGRRVPQATLEPGVPVVIGTYQLVLKPEPLPQLDTSDATVVAASGPVSATMAVPLARQATEIAPVPVPLPDAPPRPVTPAKPAPAAKPVAPAKPAAQAKPVKPARPGGRGMLKWVLIGGAAVLVLAAVIAGVMLAPVGGPRSGPAAAASASAPTAAAPSAGTPAEVPAAPAVEPPPVASAPETPPVAAPSAIPPPAAVSMAKPRSEPQASARPVVTPTATPQRTQPPARRGVVPPAAVEPKAKGPNLALAFEEARAAVNRGDYPAAIAGLESILSVDPAYPKATDLLDVARSSAKNAAKAAVDAGAKAEADRDPAEAERQYERALQADPQSTEAQDGLRRVKARMLSEGEDAFKRARQYDALGRVQDAISMYEKAIQLLPSDHASLKIARERLAALKGGVER
jgi:predicted component of type VI protein secretion system